MQRESRASASGDRGRRGGSSPLQGQAGGHAPEGPATTMTERAHTDTGHTDTPLMSRHHDSNHPPGAEQVGGASSPPASACQSLTGSPWSCCRCRGRGPEGDRRPGAPSKPIKQQQAHRRRRFPTIPPSLHACYTHDLPDGHGPVLMRLAPSSSRTPSPLRPARSWPDTWWLRSPTGDGCVCSSRPPSAARLLSGFGAMSATSQRDGRGSRTVWKHGGKGEGHHHLDQNSAPY